MTREEIRLACIDRAIAMRSASATASGSEMKAGDVVADAAEIEEYILDPNEANEQ